MFNQLITPVGDSLFLSFLAAIVPIATVLILLGVVRRPAWQASLGGLIVGLVIATQVWRLPIGLALDSIAAGAVFGLWPVMWTAFNGLVLYNLALHSGRIDAFRAWMIGNLPNDRRIVLVVIGFCFGALMEGISGVGTPVAITSALLIALGYPALEALTFTLIFNTAPVAFGQLGVPVVTLAAVTQLSDQALGAMIGRQLPFLALLLPFYVIGIYGGLRSIRALWPVLAVAGGAFALGQFLTANFISYALTDVLSSLSSLIATILFLKIWRFTPDPEFALVASAREAAAHSRVAPWQGWIPWVVVSIVVIVWTERGFTAVGQNRIEWPGLHNQIFITLYEKPYAAIWNFQPLAVGSAIIVATLLIAIAFRVGIMGVVNAVRATFAQLWSATVVVAIILGLAYLINYSGIAYTLGLGVASAGFLFPLVSAFLGWVAVFLSGSDNAGNALFGNLQVVAARQLNLSPILMAATNSSGGVMGKMISPQNLCTGAAVTEYKGREGLVLARTFKHSLILTFLLGLLVMLQQYVFPWMIPPG